LRRVALGASIGIDGRPASRSPGRAPVAACRPYRSLGRKGRQCAGRPCGPGERGTRRRGPAL